MATSIFKLMANQVFDCGKCVHCRKKRGYELACKCVLHSSLYQQNSFLTLTYDEKKEGYHNDFNYPDIQKFKKRVRQFCKRNYGKKIEIFNVHEYGKNGKKHWHLILFGHDFSHDPKPNLARTLFTVHGDHRIYTSLRLTQLWPHGFNTIGSVEIASAMYQTQYMEKDLINGNSRNSKKSHSKHAGIGKPYFLKNYAQILKLGYIPINGGKLPIPRSFIKIAHKHYCHYYEPSAFFDEPKGRKALYRPFKHGMDNLELANLYILHKSRTDERKLDLEKQWALTIETHLTTKHDPDFLKSLSNTMYELNKKELGDQF